MSGTNVEFYLGSIQSGYHATVYGVGAVPRKGDLINIRKRTFVVESVSWVLDQADGQPDERKLTAVVTLSEAPND